MHTCEPPGKCLAQHMITLKRHDLADKLTRDTEISHDIDTIAATYHTIAFPLLGLIYICKCFLSDTA